MREYRARLVAEVVMGKLDVRSSAENLPEEMALAELVDEAEVLVDDGALTEDVDGEIAEIEG